MNLLFFVINAIVIYHRILYHHKYNYEHTTNPIKSINWHTNIE